MSPPITSYIRRGWWRVPAVLIPLLLLLIVSYNLGVTTQTITAFDTSPQMKDAVTHHVVYSPSLVARASRVDTITAFDRSPQIKVTGACMDGVVTAQPGGRLGNLLMEYACSAILANRHHLRLAMPARILEPLSAIFHNLSAEPLGRVLQQPPCEGNLTEEEFLDDPKHQLLTWGSVEKTLSHLRSKHLPLIFKRYMILPEYLAPSFEFLGQEFRFRPELQSVASEKLHKIRLETASATGTSYTQVCTVGVHVRRTDYKEFMQNIFQLKQPAGLSYYKAAADAMLTDLRHECAAVAFAVTSDDNQWCQQNLLPTLTRNASKDSPASVGFLMSSDSPADDLCLLSSCQHLIMTYGTFGLSAAILCGGRTIVYDAPSHGAKDGPSAHKMAAMVPGWRLVA
ncbi:galactoside alpha-(1,2)-fucosyltransferase 2-like [Schistocerca gregaria]|uniref:galactoside alpha-(1,2)-fucosyltransferase 2-like n=1 Tax=Schistocerca gregaria TaxID=7010 RepID=UPI00211EC06F|nr:galactoside alpha-(1,2)-fucosyltransferase 2-like [Schistocerca gregaria]